MRIACTIGDTDIEAMGDITSTFKNLLDPLGIIPNIPKKKTGADVYNAMQRNVLKNSPETAQTTSILNYVYSQANEVFELMKSRLPSPAASYAVYQSYFETAAYSDYKWKQYNNGSGIHYNKQKGARLGKNEYAWFDSRMAWADAFAHELKKGANPAGAASLEDYVNRLAKNHYFGTGSPSDYLAGLKRARLVLKVIPAEQRAVQQPDGSSQDKQDLDIPGSTDYSKNKSALQQWEELPWYGKGAAILLGVVVIKAVAK